MIQDKRVLAIGGILALFGAAALIFCLWTAVRDYRDFRAMRVWVAQMQQAQKRQAEQRQQQSRGGPPPPAQSPVPDVER